MLRTTLHVILALLAINIIIGIHEAGHFLTCKLFSIKTPEFSIGFGPLLVSQRIGETQFSLRAFPIGGYVEIAGMTQEDKQSSNFYERPYYQKAIVTMSGIVCNILLAMIIFNIIPPEQLRHTLRDKVGLERGFLGPIGIISVLMRTAAVGSDAYWGFIGVLSANLAFINALPLPFLDGGHFASYTLQALQENITLNEAQQALLLAALFFLIMYMIYRSTTK